MLDRNIVHDKLGRKLIQCQNKLIDFDDNFRLYITTCLPNPHYTPGLASKISLLDFTVTGQGLHQKVLSTIVAEERFDLQERKENFITENAKNIELLYKFESNILEVLSSSEGNILEDENAINILSTSKIMSEEIQTKQLNACDTEVDIDRDIEKYNAVAKHAALLYYCLMQLANINYVYQYSLDWFMELFIESVRNTPKEPKPLTDRLSALNEMFTKFIQERIIQTLYRRDRVAFLFMIRIELMRSENGIRDDELHFLLSQEKTFYSKDPSEAELIFDWLSKESNQMVIKAANLTGFSSLQNDILDNENEWKAFCVCQNPLETTLPKPFDGSDPIKQLIIIKCLRPDYVSSAIEKYVTDSFCSKSLTSCAVHLKSIFDYSKAKTPIIYLTSEGTAVSADIANFAYEMGMNDR